MPNIRVDDLLWREKKVAGIIAGEDKIEANVVIAADGAVSLMAEKAGLKTFEVKQFALGMKEIIELPEKTIEDRFNLTHEEGAAQLFVGQCTKEVPGGGFIYTNKTSLSVGIVVYIDRLIEKKIDSHEIIREFNENPVVAKLIEGGKILEYSAHVIPETSRSRLFTDGMLVVGDAGGLVVNSGITLRGMDMAIASGAAASEAVKNAMGKNDFSKECLSYYEDLLRKDFVLKDIATFKKASEFLQNDRLYTLYPEIACRLFYKLWAVDGAKKRAFDELLDVTKGNRMNMILDVLKGLRAL